MRYTTNDLAIIEGLEVIRWRPSMYIGAGVAEGSSLCPRLVEAALNGVVDDVPAPSAIRVTRWRDGVFTIAWDGEPLPIGASQLVPIAVAHPEATGLACSAQDVVAAEADADVRSVLGSADEQRGLATVRRFARHGGGEVDDVVIQRQPSVGRGVACTVVEDEALRVDEPLELVQEQAALGVEGWLTVLEGSVDAPVRGRQRARQTALGGADVTDREWLPVSQNESRSAGVRPLGRRRAVPDLGRVGAKPLEQLPGSGRGREFQFPRWHLRPAPTRSASS